MASKDILKKVSEALGRQANEKNAGKEQLERERRELVTSVGQNIADALTPFMQQMAEKSQITKEELKQALSEVTINVPESHVNIPEVRVPEAKVTVSMPEIRIPDIKVPQANIQYPDRMKVEMDGVDHLKPLPVMMMDTKGRPFQFPVQGGSSGGKADFLTIKGYSQSAYSELMNADGRLRVSVETGGSGLTDNELRASSVPVSQASGAIWSTAVIDIFGSAAASSVFNADNRIKVSVETGGSGITDAELRASSVPVEQVSGSIWSTYISGATGTLAANIVDSSGVAYSGSNPVPTTGTVSATDLDIRDLVNATDSIRVYQLSGASWSTEATQSGTWNIGTVTTVTSVTNSIASAIVDSSGVQYSTTNPVPVGDAGGSLTIDGTVTVGSITATTAVNLIDSTGVAYSGSNPVPVTATVSGSITSTVVTGPTVADAADDGSAPVQIGGIARTANPTAVAANDVVKTTYDDLGRQVIRTLQVRDLIQTAYVSVTNGTETTLRAAVAGAFLDLIMIVGSNNSDAAVSIDIRPVTGGNIINTLRIPANGTAGWTPPVPWPQSEQGNNWTVDAPDQTGSTYTFSALFSQEV